LGENRLFQGKNQTPKGSKDGPVLVGAVRHFKKGSHEVKSMCVRKKKEEVGLS